MNKFKAQFYFRSIQGLILILIAPFVPASGPAFFVIVLISIAASLCLRPLLKIDKSEIKRRVEIRRDILRRKPMESWIAIGLGIALPLLSGLVLYYLLGVSYECAALVFIGVSYLGSGYAQARLETELQDTANAVFD